MFSTSRRLLRYLALGIAPLLPLPAEDLPLATSPADLTVATDFQVDLLYAVPKEEQGSWVGITVDTKGRLITTDQYGGLYRITLPDTDSTDPSAEVEPLNITLPETQIGADWRRDEYRDSIIGAHGLLYAFDSLYVMVSENHYKQGIWRLRDTDGDDQFDQFEHLQWLEGGGEHGPHSLVLGPEGKMIYVIAGNFTELPAGLDAARPKYAGEDHLLPRMWDARGHARGRYAPGGWVARMDPDGKAIELFAQGFRNHFDASFDANGELFTFDSDMEWDIGAPWYMPTRINHIVNAGDYGWRSGAGRWPEYYPDSLPAVIDIGPSSPTGTVFGTGAKFPARYQRALFAADWTYGTLYAIHLEANGASFTAEKEEFVAGKPLPLTDIIVNPHDGAFYFLVGGRRTQSALYRVTYVGDEDTSPAAALPPTPEAKLRHQLEALQADGTHPNAIDEVWPHLSSPDRFIRWAARTVLENQLPSNWEHDAFEESNPIASIEALIGFARVAPDRYQQDIIAALSRIEFDSLAPELAQLAARIAVGLHPDGTAFRRTSRSPAGDDGSLVPAPRCHGKPYVGGDAGLFELAHHCRENRAAAADRRAYWFRCRESGHRVAHCPERPLRHRFQTRRRGSARSPTNGLRLRLASCHRWLESGNSTRVFRVVYHHASVERGRILQWISRQHPHRSLGQRSRRHRTGGVG